MENYLRLALLSTAAVIIFLISLDAWYRWRQAKLLRNKVSEVGSQSDDNEFSADSILGLDQLVKSSIEPTLSTQDLESEIDELTIEPSLVEETTPEVNLASDKADTIQLANTKTQSDLTQDLLILYVMAKPGQSFASYNLLQTLLATGLQFGEMNIFHYYLPAALGRARLFSLASATEPGEFNLDKIGEFSCKGLTLFTNLRQVPDSKQAFNAMLKTAEQLVDELDGRLYADRKTPFSPDVLKNYWQKVWKYQATLEA